MIARAIVLALLALGVSACALVRPDAGGPPRRFVLGEDAGPSAAPAAGQPLLLLAAPSASAGFDSPRMVYVTRPYELQAFASHEWVDAPARMLTPVLVRALEARGAVAVAQGGVTSGAALRLDTQLLCLQQEFLASPSRVRFALRAELSEPRSARRVASRTFEALEDAPSDDPYGGVLAANRAVSRVLDELAPWVAAEANAATPAAAEKEAR